MVFHAGVLRRFAENKLLENIEHISSVSGGSLLTGLIFRMSGYRWPSSVQYLTDTLPNLRKLLTTKSLQFDAICRLLLNPVNWRFMLSRANILAKSIKYLWGVAGVMSQLPKRPIWSINGTTAENGRRFRFKGTIIGDYEIGYAEASDFNIASAMAVSAAFPGGIGPLRLGTKHYRWFKRTSWESLQPPEITAPEYEALHLYDGGVYDNLGMEPFFDIGKQCMKNESSPVINFLIVSDASAPFLRGKIPGPIHWKRLKRIAEIGFDQARGLRVRSYVDFLRRNPVSGMYLQIGSNPLLCIERYARDSDHISKLKNIRPWLSYEMIQRAVSHKTTLARMKEDDFDLIEGHGYETALWNELVFLEE